MGQKKYTILVFSQQASKVKKFILSPLVLKAGAVSLAIFLVLSGYLIYDYLSYQKKVLDIRELRAEMSTQQAEIQSFLEKISVLEDQLSKLKIVEEQVKKDLKDVQELKKARKVPSPVSSAKKPDPPPAADTKPRTANFLGGKISTLEKERPRLVGRLHEELMELSKIAFSREQNLKELQEFLQAQKSVLLAIPCLWPTLGRVSSPFGDQRVNASSGGTRPHMGVDIAAPVGTPVVAPADGIVTFAGRESEYGLLVSIDHGYGFTTLFGHLSGISVKPGEKVRAGQSLGAVGTSGSATGPHLHYEVRVQGRPVNPSSYLNRMS